MCFFPLQISRSNIDEKVEKALQRNEEICWAEKGVETWFSLDCFWIGTDFPNKPKAHDPKESIKVSQHVQTCLYINTSVLTLHLSITMTRRIPEGIPLIPLGLLSDSPVHKKGIDYCHKHGDGQERNQCIITQLRCIETTSTFYIFIKTAPQRPVINEANWSKLIWVKMPPRPSRQIQI